jgi:Na+/melibiose symporter-like transporter
MKGKYFRMFLVDIMHFIALLICWIIIWTVSGLDLTSWRGLALFIAVIAISMLWALRNWAHEMVEDKYNGK